jgi:hypothetical protein
MSASGKFYLAQAATCAQAAEKTQLANQREKYLRAQAAWQALADRENGIVAARDLREAEKAAIAGVDELSSLEETPDSPELATITT